VKTKVVYIGLGSNIEQPYLQIKNAIIALNKLSGTEVLLDSGYFKSKPMGPDDQPDYVNAVVKMETEISAPELLKHCQLIEKQQGRVKTRHWGERTIDLDILLYDDRQIESNDLTVPHPGICQRDFVYKPLLKLNPDIVIPGKGLLKIIVKSMAIQSTEIQSAKRVDADFGCFFAGNIE
jgi:2-amino-4-hydroxy-6-hydroxymethyldihydropteridine diphosphokinase